jgi:tetraacyldisaccharide 4'-kinase
MGGRGKTPVVALIARMLVEAGESPAILSRGYRRRRPEDGVVIVSDGVHFRADLDRAGDEPLMLARMVPSAAVLVCDVRSLAAAVAERVLGATVHVLDDGFQHRSLRRDIDIVLVTPGDLDDRRLPFGRLRSSVSTLRRADAVVVDGADASSLHARLASLDLPAHTRVFTLQRRLGAAEPLPAARPWPGDDVPVLALAGIARPERFVTALRAAGWTVADTMPFADHHAYRASDIGRIAAAMREAGAQAVVTTSKDAVRLLPHRPLPFAVAAVPLVVSIDPPDAFASWLMGRLAEVRR